jgi:hypothetical protein
LPAISGGLAYTLKVTDANTCTAEAFKVVNPCSRLDATVKATNAGCLGDDAKIEVSGRVIPYEYSITGGPPYQFGAEFDPILDGTNDLVVKDLLGCKYEETVVINRLYPPTEINVSSKDAGCNPVDGSITVISVTAGTAAYQYNIEASANQASNLFSNLDSGCYKIGVEDVDGCIYYSIICVGKTPSPKAVTIDTLPEIFANTKGSIALSNVVNGTAPFIYTCNGTDAGAACTSLDSGYYDIYVEDAKGCF